MLFESNPDRLCGRREIHPAAKAPNSQGMGSHGEWHRSGPKAPDPSPNPLSLEEGFGAGSPGVPERQEATHRSPDSTPGEGKPEVEGGLGPADPGIDAFKKRDELGLTHRSKGTSYSLEQRQRIIAEVQKLVEAGISKVQALRSLGICRSTDYGWFRAKKPKEGISSPLQLTPVEKEAVVKKKKQEPQLSHRQISGSLGVLDSPFELLSDPQAPGVDFLFRPAGSAMEGAPVRAFPTQPDLGGGLDPFGDWLHPPLPADPHRLFFPLHCRLGSGQDGHPAGGPKSFGFGPPE